LCYSIFYLFSSSSLIAPSDEDKPKVKRFTREQQNQFTIPDELQQILVGLILGDLWANKRGNNTRFRFKQGICHKAYLPVGPKTT
jgi:hypothetical protein